MTTWIIEPRDPLIVRDGRPFGPNPGARAHSLPFPFPSTIVGAVRSRHGQHHNGGIFPSGNQAVIQQVLGLHSRGPLLVSLDEQGEIADWLLPAPGDALLLPAKGDSQQVIRRQLVPLMLPVGAQAETDDDLIPVGIAPYLPDKPASKPPQFWSWTNAYQQWLIHPAVDVVKPEALGHDGPVRENRMHVNIEPGSQTAREGYLFLTSGLEFKRPHADHNNSLKPAHRLALALETDAQMGTGFAPMGGERRLMYWRQSKSPLPQLPAGLADAIVHTGHCRLLLVTPGYFRNGSRPDWLMQARHGVQPTLVAAVLRSSEVVSGWDFVMGSPKPSRRLAPAGTVFFLKLDGTPDTIRTWVEKMWLQAVSDDHDQGSPDQNRLDGFGLAVLGSWTGQLKPMEV